MPVSFLPNVPTEVDNDAIKILPTASVDFPSWSSLTSVDKAPYRLMEDSQVEPSYNQFPYLSGVITVFTNSEVYENIDHPLNQNAYKCSPDKRRLEFNPIWIETWIVHIGIRFIGWKLLLMEWIVSGDGNRLYQVKHELSTQACIEPKHISSSSKTIMCQMSTIRR